MSAQSDTKAVTIVTLQKLKDEGDKFACLTAYDYSSAYACSTNGIKVILVGDSLGMVIQGHENSLPVSVEDVAYHMRCVRRGNNGALLMADLPFMSYYSELKTLENAALLMREGAHIVKLEGGAWLADSTKLLVQHGIPVCAHMGLTPQSINHLGGYRVQGRDPEKAQTMINEALILEDSGASLLLLECVPIDLGKQITNALEIPVIGIGAGKYTDGQIMVWHDLLGLYPGKTAKFVKNYLKDNNTDIQGAISSYAQDVEDKSFPDESHSYT